MKSVSFDFGGNQPFYELLKDFDIHQRSIADTYGSKVAKYYRRRHLALLDGRSFNEEIPAKTWNETYHRTSSKLNSKIEKYDGKIRRLAEGVGKMFRSKVKDHRIK